MNESMLIFADSPRTTVYIYILKKTRITLSRVHSMGYLQWSSRFPRRLHCQLLDVRTIDAARLSMHGLTVMGH